MYIYIYTFYHFGKTAITSSNIHSVQFSLLVSFVLPLHLLALLESRLCHCPVTSGWLNIYDFEYYVGFIYYYDGSSALDYLSNFLPS
jgi:hypothetical protein